MNNRQPRHEMDFYKEFWTRYFDFNGRTGRKDYWMTVLVNMAIIFTLFFMAGATDSSAFLMIYTVFALAAFIPSIAILVRRLHDTGRSGLWFFIIFVPFAGSIILLVFLCNRGQDGDNAYGPAVGR